MRDTRVRAMSIVGELQVERRQRQSLVVDHLDRRAAAAEHDHRPEGRVVGEAGDQFARLRPAHHRLHRHARDARPGLEARGALEDFGRGLAHRLVAGEVELDAADIGFVDDVGRQDLDRDRAALGKDRPRRGRRLLRRRGSVTGATGMS